MGIPGDLKEEIKFKYTYSVQWQVSQRLCYIYSCKEITRVLSLHVRKSFVSVCKKIVLSLSTRSKGFILFLYVRKVKKFVLFLCKDSRGFILSLYVKRVQGYYL